ncbi:MAG TPA: mannose-6-phosphate isomerase [Clostridiales bacterium]|nr:mannose-6-phosphate isomerase [Clostridiales bacterium]
MRYPMLLLPVFKENLWGGEKLKQEYGKISPLEKIAESWELSVHEQGDCTVENGAYAGRTLRDYLLAEGPGVLGVNANGELPLLVKLIDTAESLSIQVHPGDAYARMHHNCAGKTEFWYIADCEKDAALYCGAGALSKEELLRRAKDGSITDVLYRFPVRKGDAFLIEPGTIHAIGSSMTVAEIGTNCNVTYRIYDFGRTDKDGRPRELHLAQAADVFRANTGRKEWMEDSGDRLMDCGPFSVREIDLNGSREFCADESGFHYILCLEGDFAVGENRIGKGRSLFIPAGLGRYSMEGTAKLLLVLI